MRLCFILVFFLSFAVYARTDFNTSDQLYAQAIESGELNILALSHAEKALPKADNLIQNQKAEYYWRAARLCFYRGRFGSAGDFSRELFERGMQLALKARDIRPEKVEGHFWYAINLGHFMEVSDWFRALKLMPEFKRALEKSHSINPNYDQGGAARALGRLYFELPGILGGDYQKSLELFNLAIKAQEGDVNAVNFYFRAETYLKLGLEDEAKQDLKKSLEIIRSKRNLSDLEAELARPKIEEALTKLNG